LKFPVFIVLFAGIAFLAPAQTPSATVVGRVTDSTGAVVAGVSITVTNVERNVSQDGMTNEAGDFTVPYLNPGRYTLEAKANGFQSYKHSAFTLVVDQSLRIDIALQVGSH
jgi:uncharacterized surface anchored protein